MSAMFSRADQSVLGRWWWTVDRGTLAAVAILVVIGVMLVTAASPPVALRIGVDQYHFVKRHVAVLGPSLLMMLGVSLLSPRAVWRISSVVMLLGLAGMVVVLFTGMEIKGAQRWIQFFGFSLQPSEFVKVSFAIVSAWFMARQKENPDFHGNRIAAVLFLCVITLLLLQPDLGMSVIVSCIYGAQIFLAGFPLLLVFALGCAGLGGIVAAYFTFDHVHARIDKFLDPAAGDNYQVQKALDAFQNGGLLGTGPGQGVVKLGLPDAHADFIFAVAGEEMGMIFILFLIALFGFILLRGFNRLMDSNDMFTVLAAGGLLTMFGLQAVVHMGANLHLLPAKGMTLPFISYGGSSMLATALAMGMILALTRKQARSSIAKSGRVMKRSNAT
jgi:cell division protein FtsW